MILNAPVLHLSSKKVLMESMDNKSYLGGQSQCWPFPELPSQRKQGSDQFEEAKASGRNKIAIAGDSHCVLVLVHHVRA